MQQTGTPSADGTQVQQPPLPVQVYRVVKKNWPLILAISTVVALGVSLYTASQTKIFQAQATVQFDPQPVQPLGKEVQAVVDMGSGSYWSNREYYETQYQIIRSARVARETVKRLNLHRDPAFLANAPPGLKPASVEVAVDVAADALRARIAVAPVKDSRLANVSLTDADPARAQRVLRVLVDVYVEQNLENGLTAANTAVEWLADQLVKLKADLESSERALHSYKRDKNMLSVSYDDQTNMLREEIDQINQALTSAKTQREQLLARKKVLDSIELTDPREIPESELLQSSLLDALRSEYAAALRDRESLAAEGKGENHPEARAIAARVNTTREALAAELNNLKRAVDYDLQAKNGQVAGLTRLFEGAKANALELNMLEIEYKRLQRTATNNEKMYSFVLERTKERDLTRMMRFNNISVVDYPRLPGAPVKPRVLTNIIAGVVFGLLLGVGAAFGKEALDRSIRMPEDLESQLGLAFLGLLPSVEEGSSHPTYKRRRRRQKPADQPAGPPELMVHHHPLSGVAEAARAVRTNIMFMSPDQPFRRLLITSPSPSEGKTTVACYIGVAMAQAGQRVLLVDCDMRRPRLQRLFGVGRERGVTTALLNPSTLDSAIVPTEVPNLSVLPLGPIPPNPSELLHSDAFSRLLDTLSERFDRVVLDSPPIAPVTDATILSTKVDGTLVVVRAFQTKREVARRAVQSIRSVGGRIVGAVLNAVDLTRSDYGYYRYYYGSKSPYSADPTSEDAEPEPQQPAA